MVRAVRSLIGDPQLVEADRAIAEFRAGRPVLVRTAGAQALAVGIEGIDDNALPALADFAAGRARLLLPAARLRRLGLDRTAPGAIAMPVLDKARLEALALRIDGRIDAPVAPAQPVDETALELAALSFVLPAVVIAPVDAKIDAATSLPGVAIITAQALAAHRRAQAKQLHIVSRAPVPLEEAPRTEFVVFRGGEGMRDQVAIIVGELDRSRPIAVRLHSACLTGDLFGSLKCDCGDQLRETVRWMADNDGGILLYLDQEGRGNGIANKMRAYKLQSEGFDTYDADEMLGFDLDQRRFEFAAEMLKQLDVHAVRMLTNNPVKIGALRAAGLDVVSEQRVLGRPNPENVRYLASKRDRAGHYIDFDALAARAPAHD